MLEGAPAREHYRQHRGGKVLADAERTRERQQGHHVHTGSTLGEAYDDHRRERPEPYRGTYKPEHVRRRTDSNYPATHPCEQRSNCCHQPQLRTVLGQPPHFYRRRASNRCAQGVARDFVTHSHWVAICWEAWF